MDVPTGDAYHPSEETLRKLRGVIFIAIVGPTAAGKTTLMNAAAARDPRFHVVHNNTSREPREYEQEGAEYHFADRAEMEARISRGEFVQVAPSLFGDLYGTAPEDYGRSGLSMLPVVAGAMPVFRALPFKALRTLFVVPPDYQTWHERIVGHGFSAEQLTRRLREAEQSLVFGLEDEAAELLISGDLLYAVDDFMTLALAEPKTPRIRIMQSQARLIAADMLQRLRADL